MILPLKKNYGYYTQAKTKKMAEESDTRIERLEKAHQEQQG